MSNRLAYGLQSVHGTKPQRAPKFFTALVASATKTSGVRHQVRVTQTGPKKGRLFFVPFLNSRRRITPKEAVRWIETFQNEYTDVHLTDYAYALLREEAEHD